MPKDSKVKRYSVYCRNGNWLGTYRTKKRARRKSFKAGLMSQVFRETVHIKKIHTQFSQPI